MDALAQPIPLRLLIDEAVKLVRLHFRQLYLPVAIPLALLSGTIPLVQGIFLKGAGTSNPFATMGGIFALILASLLFMIVYVLGYTTFLIACLDTVSGVPVSMRRAWLATLRPRVFGTVLLAGFLAAVASLCCLLPGVYVGLLLCLVVPVMAAEGRFGPDALGRSRQLITYNPRGDFGADPRVKAFVIVFVGWLLAYVIGMVIALPLIVVQQVLMFRNIASGARMDPETLMAVTIWLQVPANMLGMLARAAVMLYVSFALTVLFFDLRRRREGVDLQAAIEGLAAGPAPGDHPA